MLQNLMRQNSKRLSSICVCYDVRVDTCRLVCNTGWPRKNATTLIVNFMNIVDETELFCISFGRTFIFPIKCHHDH